MHLKHGVHGNTHSIEKHFIMYFLTLILNIPICLCKEHIIYKLKYQPFRDSNLNEMVSNGHNSVDMCNHSTKLDKSIFVKFISK